MKQFYPAISGPLQIDATKMPAQDATIIDMLRAIVSTLPQPFNGITIEPYYTKPQPDGQTVVVTLPCGCNHFKFFPERIDDRSPIIKMRDLYEFILLPFINNRHEKIGPASFDTWYRAMLGETYKRLPLSKTDIDNPKPLVMAHLWSHEEKQHHYQRAISGIDYIIRCNTCGHTHNIPNPTTPIMPVHDGLDYTFIRKPTNI